MKRLLIGVLLVFANSACTLFVSSNNEKFTGEVPAEGEREGEGDPPVEGCDLSVPGPGEARVRTSYVTAIHPLLTRPASEGGCTACHVEGSGRLMIIDDNADVAFNTLRDTDMFANTSRAILARVQTGAMPPGGPEWVPSEQETLLDFICDVSKLTAIPPQETRLDARVWRLTPEQFANEVSALLPGFSADSIPGSEGEKGFNNIAAKGAIDQSTAQRIAAIAMAASAYVQENATSVSDCDSSDRACIEPFLDAFAARAYRRPLSDAEVEGLRTLYNEIRGDTDETYALGSMVQAMLMSPYFLYRTELGAPFGGETTGIAGAGESIVVLSNDEIANLIAFTLTDRGPDDLLKAAAADGLLRDPEVRKTHARRLLSGADEVWRRFFWEWLGLENFDAQFDVQGGEDPIRNAMRQEFDEFISRTVSDEGRLANVFSDTHTWVAPELADFYGVDHSGEGMEQVFFDPDARAGLLTQGAWLVSHSSAEEEYIVRRGMPIFRDVLCNELTPPEGLDLVAETEALAGPNATPREVVDARGSDPTCGACHAVPDPVGLAFETYDGLGRIRTEYPEGEPVDSVAEVPGIGQVQNAAELARALATSADFQSCFMERFSHAFMGANLGATKRVAWTKSVYEDMRSNDRSLEEVVVSFVAHPGFIERKRGSE